LLLLLNLEEQEDRGLTRVFCKELKQLREGGAAEVNVKKEKIGQTVFDCSLVNLEVFTKKLIEQGLSLFDTRKVGRFSTPGSSIVLYGNEPRIGGVLFREKVNEERLIALEKGKEELRRDGVDIDAILMEEEKKKIGSAML